MDKNKCITIGDLNDIFLLDTLDDNYRNKHFQTYAFNDIPVPRVSQILKEMCSKEFLINWAARIGQREMAIQRNKATTIGSRVHEMIEGYLLEGKKIDISYKTSNYLMPEIETAYANFIDWILNINKLGYQIEEIVAIEKQVVCPYYGGTIDCIMKINGKYYIVDFKTSKSISYEYILQTCSYMWIINNGYSDLNIHIDGIGIIRVDKEKIKFEDIFLNENIPSQKLILDQYYSGFGSLLLGFYNIINMKSLYNNYKKEYNIEKSL